MFILVELKGRWGRTDIDMTCSMSCKGETRLQHNAHFKHRRAQTAIVVLQGPYGFPEVTNFNLSSGVNLVCNWGHAEMRCAAAKPTRGLNGVGETMTRQQFTEAWLASFPALQEMAGEHLALAQDHVQFPTLAAGDVAYHQGWECPNYVMCIGGKTRVFKTSEGGREILIYSVSSGGTCVLTTHCLLAGGTFPAESTAETEATLAAIPSAQFHALMAQSDVFRKFVLDDYMRLLSTMISLVDEVAFATLDQRLAGRLLADANSIGLVEKTHQQLAQDLGSVREVVSRYLSDWERAGWIKTARGSIQIVNSEALASYKGG